MQSAPELRIYLLGPIQVILAERPIVNWKYAEAQDLLFYLLVHTARKPTARKPSAESPAVQLIGKKKSAVCAALWPDRAKHRLSSTLKSRLLALRNALGDRDWVLFEDGEYKLNRNRPVWFDVETFEQKAAQGKQAQASSPEQAIAFFQEALALYGGDFLSELPERRSRDGDGLASDEAELLPEDTDDDADLYSDDEAWREREHFEWYAQKQSELRELHANVLHRLGKLLVAAGRYEAALEIYGRAVAEDDYDDDAHYGIMLCYSSQGKRSRALNHYRKLRERRSDTPPDTLLVKLAERLKRAEELRPGPAAPPAPPYAADSGRTLPPPFQPPPALAHFVGREEELRLMQSLVGRAVQPRRFFLAGMGGIGKTAFTIQLAHLLRAQFPDGTLWARLSQSEPLAIMDSWARAFGFDLSALPDLESRAAALRSLLHGKQILFVLDDVWSVVRVRPLSQLAGPQCLVLLNGRNVNVAAALDAQVVAVPSLPASDSMRLLTNIIGEQRVVLETVAAAEICSLVGGLPLALEIVAQRLVSRPRWRLAEMAGLLRDQRRRLDELRIEDDREVRASFAVSWNALDEPLRQGFALLAVFEGRSFASEAMVAAAEHEPVRVANDLDALVALSLLSADGSSRYRQHPLLADFALEKLASREAADRRMAAYYLGFASTHRQDRAALEEDWDNLSAGVEISHTQKSWQAVIDYADILSDVWFALGRFADARRIYPWVCEAAIQPEIEEQDAYIAATLNWGRACIKQGAFAEAGEIINRGLKVCEDVADPHGIGMAKHYLGWVAAEEGKFVRAQELYTESLTVKERLGDQFGIAEILHKQSEILFFYEQYEEAVEVGLRSLAIREAIADEHGRVRSLCHLAITAARMQNAQLAETYVTPALELAEAINDMPMLANASLAKARISQAQGDYALARASADRALDLFEHMGALEEVSHVLYEISRLELARGELQPALAAARRGLALCREMNFDLGAVHTLRHLGHIYGKLTQPDASCAAWQEGLAIASRLDLRPLVEALESLLRENGCPPPTTSN